MFSDVDGGAWIGYDVNSNQSMATVSDQRIDCGRNDRLIAQ